MAIGIELKEIINSKIINNRGKDLQHSRCRRLRHLQIIKAFTAIKARIKVCLALFLFNPGRAIPMIKVVDAGARFGFQTDWHPGNGFLLQDRPEVQNVIMLGIM